MVSHTHYLQYNDIENNSPAVTWWDEACSALMWAHIDAEQSSQEERDALKEFLDYNALAKRKGEWHTSDCNITLEEQLYIQYLDEKEMCWDMSEWEDNMQCHQLFAENPWGSRHNSAHCLVNKRSEIILSCKLIHCGKDYFTAISPYGKIYIPSHLWSRYEPTFTPEKTFHHFSVTCPVSPEDPMDISLKVRFLGFAGCNNKCMPWRAEKILDMNQSYSYGQVRPAQFREEPTKLTLGNWL